MKYELPTEVIPKQSRAAINSKILMLLSSGNMQGISAGDIFKAYTGDGGLHGLKFKNYDNYNQFSSAKKEIENGQFFTPAELCEKISECVPVKDHHLVADLTFGMGNFFNFMPVESNIYGCELDAKAFKVANFLYPEANLVNQDLIFYTPEVSFDIIFGNPPFNIEWKVGKDTIASQKYFLEKSLTTLTPGGILAIIVPHFFLGDTLNDSHYIKFVNSHFSFLCQAKLPRNAFSKMGVSSYSTKIIFLQKKYEGMAYDKPFVIDEFVPFNSDFIRDSIIQYAIEDRDANRHKNLASEAVKGKNNWSFKNSSLRNNSGFEFQLSKLLFEIKAHPAARKDYSKAVNIITQFKTQQAPDGMSHAEWQRIRLTEAKVLFQIRRLLNSKLNPKPKKTGFGILKNQNGLMVKAFDHKASAYLKSKHLKINYSFHELVQETKPFSGHDLESLFNPFLKLIRQKRRLFLAQGKAFSEITPTRSVVNKLSRFSFVHKDGNSYKLNDVQKRDISLLVNKPFGGILNWQQGGGKTIAGWAVKSLIGDQFKNTIIVGPPIAIQMTWIPFIKRQNGDFIEIKEISNLIKIQPGQVVIISTTKVVELQRFIKIFLTIIKQKALLIFDESDDITNYSSKRSKAIRNVFRRTKFKLLTTGTTTRNNIAELYGQLELIFNNSYNFICEAREVFKEKVENGFFDIFGEINLNQGLPFEARGGRSLFKSCFSPTRASVFGVAKYSQKIYNASALDKIIASTIITRKFSEIVGPDKYELFTHTIKQQPWEADLYQKILTEFHTIIHNYFGSTGDYRKDAMLRIMLQIKALIRACSIPNIMAERSEMPTKTSKIIEIIKRKNTKTMVGTISKRAAAYTCSKLREAYPDRRIFLITGESVPSFKKRQAIIDEFEATENGILVSTQQSLSSSVNIPLCTEVIIESLNWNLPRIEQYYFRTIRFDSPSKSNIHFIVYDNSIEVNIMTLLLDKELINDYIKTREFRSSSEIFTDFKLNSASFLEMLIEKYYDEDGKMNYKWGRLDQRYDVKITKSDTTEEVATPAA